MLAAPAKAQQVEWRGGGFLSSLTQACLDDGYKEHEYVSVRYRPKGFGSNGSQSRIGFFHPLFFATSYAINGNFAKSFKPVQGGGTSAGTFLFETTMKLTQKPSKLTDSTPSVELSGQIRNYGGTPDCTMAFEVNLTRRP
ncbi:hypothetical protein [Microbaculum marinum]|uniref:Uncharacterized protein n=1 Tax=Microbaculum marinum TaxID=1764581 RepID=A0AAW9RMF8_9HYPH